MTVTVKVQLTVLLEASVTLQETVVVPVGNEEPDAGAQTGDPTPGQLSLTVGAVYVTVAEHWPLTAGVVMFAGQVIVGG